MATQTFSKLVGDKTVAYLQTDKGKDHYNNLFPNHNDQCVHLKASKFLGVYLSSRKGGKWAELCEKLGISEHYKLNKIKKNVGNNVKTAQKHLSQHADIVAQTLPPQQPPTSTNNNISAATGGAPVAAAIVGSNVSAAARLQNHLNESNAVDNVSTPSIRRAPGNANNGVTDNVGDGGGGGSGGGGGGGGENYEAVVSENVSLKQKVEELERKYNMSEAEKSQLQERMKQSEDKRMLLKVEKKSLKRENDTLKDALGIAKDSASSLTASLQFAESVRSEMKHEVKDLKDDLEDVKDIAEELQEDFGNLRNDHDGLAGDHDELKGDVAYDRDRRESKDNEYDENMYKLEKAVEENHDYVGETADNWRREWEEENETLNAARNDAALDHVNEAFAAEMDDQNVNVHKVQNDLANQQEQLNGFTENMALVVAFMEETKQAEHRRQAERRRRSF